MRVLLFQNFLVGVVFFIGVRKVNKRLKCGMLQHAFFISEGGFASLLSKV